MTGFFALRVHNVVGNHAVTRKKCAKTYKRPNDRSKWYIRRNIKLNVRNKDGYYIIQKENIHLQSISAGLLHSLLSIDLNNLVSVNLFTNTYSVVTLYMNSQISH